MSWQVLSDDDGTKKRDRRSGLSRSKLNFLDEVQIRLRQHDTQLVRTCSQLN